MRENYLYLQDPHFLYKVDTLKLKKQFIKITLLDWNENPIQEIQGFTTSGSISLDGKSAMRRSCNLSAVIPEANLANVTNVNNLFSINTFLFNENKLLTFVTFAKLASGMKADKLQLLLIADFPSKLILPLVVNPCIS